MLHRFVCAGRHHVGYGQQTRSNHCKGSAGRISRCFSTKAGSARSRKHHNEHFHIETKGKDASSNVPQSKLKPKGAWKSVKMTNRQIKYGHLTLKMANFTGCLAPIFDPYPLHEMNLARNRDLQRSFAEN